MRFWFDVGQLIGTALLGVYVYVSNRHRVTNKRISETDDRVTALEKKIDKRCLEHQAQTERIGAELRHLPSTADIRDLSAQLTVLTEKLGHLDGRLTGINRAVDLLNQHHINGGK
jgi:hypothetical protein